MPVFKKNYYYSAVEYSSLYSEKQDSMDLSLWAFLVNLFFKKKTNYMCKLNWKLHPGQSY